MKFSTCCHALAIVALVAALLIILASPAGAQMRSAYPPLPPADAAAVLRVSPGLSNRTDAPPPIPEGPRWIVINSSSTAGPFGEFRFSRGGMPWLNNSWWSSTPGSSWRSFTRGHDHSPWQSTNGARPFPGHRGSPRSSLPTGCCLR